ncbi:GNAT family N-acetyltransferase [Paucibacter sp. AS339]|uniref:GNAT family N-acetyltransferase n=1 Tax=Paucibacter hankyongi TaxID=3133434 RepID=UPI00309A270B
MNLITIAVEADPDRLAKNAIQSGLFDANVAYTGDGHLDAVLVVARDDHSNVIGGVVGEAYWGWVNLTAVWVHPEQRRKGLASQLLQAAEAEAVRLGYTQAYLDTFSFQAPELYLRAGYEIFGALDNFPVGAKRLFLRKAIGGIDAS